ncbi:MAG: biotin--[acetyl-CoA-carboxylase] ligase [Flavobacteriales bacterium]
MPERSPPRPQNIGSQVIELPSVDSTNKYAAESLRLSNLQHGAVILAHEQTGGRGQRGRTWHAAPGLDLTCSVVLRPAALRVDEQFRIAQAAALAVHATVAARVPGTVRVKWPNDILIDRAKVAGILIQNELAGEHIAWTIIGIGLNVNSTDMDPSHRATGLRLAAGRAFDLREVLSALCAALGEQWELMEQDPALLARRYRDALWSGGRWTAAELDGNPLMVRPIDVDATGRLIIEGEDGGVLAYGLDRLRLLRE